MYGQTEFTCSSKRDKMQLAHSPGFCVAIFTVTIISA